MLRRKLRTAQLLRFAALAVVLHAGLCAGIKIGNIEIDPLKVEAFGCADNCSGLFALQFHGRGRYFFYTALFIIAVLGNRPTEAEFYMLAVSCARDCCFA
jgi:hypothetical protein